MIGTITKRLARLGRAIRRSFRSSSGKEAQRLIDLGNRARDSHRHNQAAMLYAQALALTPDDTAIHVQAGHMFKEARDFSAADYHYRQAARQRPDDADLQLQLGHFNKTVDRLDAARRHYFQAARLVPGWTEPERELAAIARRDAAFDDPSERPSDIPVPELVPDPIKQGDLGPIDIIRFLRLGGRQTMSTAGPVPLLSGVEAVRGTCFSDRSLVQAAILIDGKEVAREAIVSTATNESGIVKAVFNLWVDLSSVAPGSHRLDLVLIDGAGWTRRGTERIVIAEPPSCETMLLDSDGCVTLASDDPRTVEQQVRDAASIVRPVDRRVLPQPSAILVLRTDQLGDMVVAIPAVQRLRALFPTTRIVGLLTAANVDLARTLGLFDEIIIADFPDNPEQRRRTMTVDAQRSLQARLATYHFDVAIDLATSEVSRQLLRLTGARLTFGFDDGASPWLDGGISGHVRDPRNVGEAAPQSGRMLALVERLGTLYATGASIVRRPDLYRSRLRALGLDDDDRFIVLHAGARVSFSRWPGFLELVRAWLGRHIEKVVLLTEGTDLAASLPFDLRVEDRLVVIHYRLPFDDLDALLSFATLFIGNDSGPKHLAALRGTPVVSIHCARIGWAEWGQEQTGVIVSRRVPCAGCAIFHDVDECGKEFACITDIRVAEVLAAAEGLLAIPDN